MNVPTAELRDFEDAYESGTLTIELEIHYRSKAVRQASFSWSADDIRTTHSYKTLTSTGAEFVDANQLEQMVREVVSAKNAVIMQDPGVPRQLADQASQAFANMLKVEADAKVSIVELEQVRKLEEKLLAGTGLTAEQFKPITVMWEVSDRLTKVEDSKTANDTLRKYFDEKTNRDKIDGCAGAGWGPFSAKLGYEKEMTQKNVEEGYFKNQNEYDEFRSKHHTERGLRPVITPRGLKLMERKQFENNIGFAVSSVAFYPVDQSKFIQIRTTMLPRGEKSTRVSLFEQVPVGVVVAYGGERPPEGWLLCNGREYNVGERPDLLSLADKLGDRYFDREKQVLRLPDLKGRTVFGVGEGKGLSKREIGQFGGDETQRLTESEMPRHGHRADATTATDEQGKLYGLVVSSGSWHKRVLVTGGENLPTTLVGENKAYSIMPPFLVLNYIIKY